MQAQLEELLAAVCLPPQAAFHSPTTIPDTSSDLPLDPPGSEPLPVVTDTPLPSAVLSNVPARVPTIKAAALLFFDGNQAQRPSPFASWTGPPLRPGFLLSSRMPTRFYLSSNKHGVLKAELLATQDAAGVSSPEILMESPEKVAEPDEEDF
ncbi:hypothetical protein H0H92_005419 [Tricholoma furcatifolium]|nr:hypothetical protein H0H92_005419 [Tricholoma furcatifolium]